MDEKNDIGIGWEIDLENETVTLSCNPAPCFALFDICDIGGQVLATGRLQSIVTIEIPGLKRIVERSIVQLCLICDGKTKKVVMKDLVNELTLEKISVSA